MSQEDTTTTDDAQKDADGKDTTTTTTDRTDDSTTDDQRTTFDREYVEKLRRENAAARKRAQDAETRAKEYEDRDKTEQQKLTEKAQADAERADKAEQKLLRFEVAAAKGIPAKLAGRLQGSTREEMEQDADDLLETIGAGGGNDTDDFDAGRRGSNASNGRNFNDEIRARAGVRR